MTHTASLITRPDAHPAKNVRRAGAPNHLQGSKETPMVGANSTAPDAATVAAVRTRLNGQTHRFLSVDQRGRLTVRVDQLVVLVAEIVTEYTEHVIAERDALAEDLAWELNAAHTDSRTDSERSEGGAA